MAFVSQIKYAPLRRRGMPGVTFRETLSTSGGGYITSSTPLRGMRIDIQIDENSNCLRLAESADGVSVTKSGQFSCPRRIFEIVGSQRITLELSDDGWWYGSYGDAS